MPASRDELEKALGTAWHPNANAVIEKLAYTTYAGDPTNNLTPDFIGQHCLDTENDNFYIATTAASSGWAVIHS